MNFVYNDDSFCEPESSIQAVGAAGILKSSNASHLKRLAISTCILCGKFFKHITSRTSCVSEEQERSQTERRDGVKEIFENLSELSVLEIFPCNTSGLVKKLFFLLIQFFFF